MTVYIVEANSTINGMVRDVTEYIGTGEHIICTLGHHNVFFVNGDQNGNLLRIQDVRIIHMHEDITEFECWSTGDRINSISVEIPTEKVETVICGGHFHTSNPVDMSHF